jgi:hypothetical protein
VVQDKQDLLDRQEILVVEDKQDLLDRQEILVLELRQDLLETQEILVVEGKQDNQDQLLLHQVEMLRLFIIQLIQSA